MRVNAAVILELAIVLGALAIGCAGLVAALRARAAALADRLALRLALVRESALLESARRLADAARASVETVRSVLDDAIRAIAPVLDVFLLFEEEEGVLRCVHASGARATYFSSSAMSLDDDRIAPLIARDHYLLGSGATRALHPGDRSFAFFPLDNDAGRRVLVYVASSSGALDSFATTIAAIVDQARPAYRLALEREDDKRRAEYDGLTGLLTPRAFRARLAAMLDRARADARARIALIFVDTDHFKVWNDTFGHESGDAILRQIATILQRCSRLEADLVARNGGDEFCLVLTAIDKAEAIDRALDLRAAIAAAERADLRPPGARAQVAVTASIGVATLPIDASTARELLERADAAMYHAKNSGRDGVSYYDVDGALRRVIQENVISDPV